MWFLLIQISLMLALAALFGAGLAYWWFTRRYQDVTESFTQLSEVEPASTAGLLTKLDFDSRLNSLSPDFSPMEARLGNMEAAIGSLAFPETDLSPLETRLINLERTVNQFRVPEPDLGSIEDRLIAIESVLTAPQTDDMDTRFVGLETSLANLYTATSHLENTDTTRLERQMDVIATAIAERGETDLSPVETRLGGLEDAVSAIAIPEVDLGPIHSGLTRIEMSLSNLDMPTTDLSGVETRISALQEGVLENRTLSARDLEAAQQRLTDIETRISHIRIPETDMGPVDESLGYINSRLSSLEAGVAEAGRNTVDLTPIEQRVEQLQLEIMRLERMEGTLSTLRMDVQQSTADLDPLHQRIDMLQREITALDPLHQRIDNLHRDFSNQPDPDLSPVVNSVQAIERRMDFAAMENRLTSIEYGLAALHHMLRTRQIETSTTGYRAPEPMRTPTPPPPAFTAPVRPEPQSYRNPPPPREQWSEPVPMPQTYEVPPPQYETRTQEYRTYTYEDTQPEPAPAPRDVISEARRPDDKANLLTRPAFGPADDLEEISGVGPMLHGLLTEIGVFYFWQVAEWEQAEIEWVDDMLDGFNGRIERDDWVGQAKILATGANAAKRP